jgi:TPP-dependent trihydroxycyclohexane-1,2-dione (THcHDO) dehydratase
VILVDIAQEALDSAKSAHRRIDGLEAEVKDIRGLTAAMARVDQKVDGLDSDVKEIKADVKVITSRPGKWWDKLVAAAIGAVGTGIVAAILAVILK